MGLWGGVQQGQASAKGAFITHKRLKVFAHQALQTPSMPIASPVLEQVTLNLGRPTGPRIWLGTIVIAAGSGSGRCTALGPATNPLGARFLAETLPCGHHADRE